MVSFDSFRHVTPLEFDDTIHLNDYKHSIRNGIIRAIKSPRVKTAHREWLLQFFAAMERKEGRAAILAGLKEARASFKASEGK